MTELDKDRLHFSNRKYRIHLIVCFLSIALILAAALRLSGMDQLSLPGPEIYVPGILFALGSIPLTFLIARRVFGSTVGGVAALMLTLHGFHISLSQTAPMYVAGVFLSLLATWLLFLLVRARAPRVWLEAGYIASVIGGALTAELFWLLIVVHVFWAILVLPRVPTTPGAWIRQIGFFKAPRLLQTQTIAIILAAPAISHSVYRARQGAGQGPSEDFLMEYFSFGFLVAKDDFTIPASHIGAVGACFLLAFALLLLVAGLKAPKREAPLFTLKQTLPPWLPVVAAVASAGVMLWLTPIAHRRADALMALALLPFLALNIPVLATIWRIHVPRLPSRSLHLLQERALFLWLIAVVSPLVLFIASYKTSFLAPQPFMILAPYYLILCAAGAVWMFRRRTFRWIIISLTIVVFSASVPYATHKSATVNDKKDFAKATQATGHAD